MTRKQEEQNAIAGDKFLVQITPATPELTTNANVSVQEMTEFWKGVPKDSVLQFKLKLKSRSRPTMPAIPSNGGMLAQIPEDPSEGRATEVGRVPDKIDRNDVFVSMTPVTARGEPTPEPVVQAEAPAPVPVP